MLIMFLAPRVLVKFFTTTYMPLDKDIVREQWVKGDLKDRLGIQHRREGKPVDLETAAMYKNPHLRSQSEADPADYQPVLSGSPNSTMLSPPTKSTLGFATPDPHSSPGLDGDDSQYIMVDPPLDGPSHLRGPLSGRSSLVPSYYSASDIPAPSPMPPVHYSTPRAPPDSGPSSPRHPLEQHTPPQMLSVPPSPAYHPPPSSYEMRVRGAPSPLSDLSHGPSEVSYATAREYPADEGMRSAALTPSPTQLHPPGQRHDRPESGMSWAGGRAI